jgi:hypothetical protein
MITIPYLLIVWTMNHGTMQTEYSNRAACENARLIMSMSAVDKTGHTRRDFKAVCVTKYQIN